MARWETVVATCPTLFPTCGRHHVQVVNCAAIWPVWNVVHAVSPCDSTFPQFK